MTLTQSKLTFKFVSHFSVVISRYDTLVIY